jgi:hypothetical protein
MSNDGSKSGLTRDEALNLLVQFIAYIDVVEMRFEPFFQGKLGDLYELRDDVRQKLGMPEVDRITTKLPDPPRAKT